MGAVTMRIPALLAGGTAGHRHANRRLGSRGRGHPGSALRRLDKGSGIDRRHGRARTVRKPEHCDADGFRHKASGLRCDYSPDEQNNSLMLFPGLPQGDDVGCNADAGNIYMTYYATRYGPDVSLQDAASDTAAGIRNRFSDARAYDGPVVQVDAPAGVGEQVYLAYVVGPQGRTLHAQARLARVGDWIFKQRMSTPEDMAMGAEVMLSVGRWTDVLQAAAD